MDDEKRLAGDIEPHTLGIAPNPNSPLLFPYQYSSSNLVGHSSQKLPARDRILLKKLLVIAHFHADDRGNVYSHHYNVNTYTLTRYVIDLWYVTPFCRSETPYTSS